MGIALTLLTLGTLVIGMPVAFGIGAVSQIKFSDGTTQTTAPTPGFSSCTQVNVIGSNHATVSCPAGYTATGGGCAEFSGAPLLTCEPTSPTSWECVDQNAGACSVTVICCH